MILKALLLAGLIKLLIETEQPLLCAVIYSFVAVALGFVMEVPALYLLVAAPISFLFLWLYFWLLSRLDGIPWFIVLVLGAWIVFL